MFTLCLSRNPSSSLVVVLLPTLLGKSSPLPEIISRHSAHQSPLGSVVERHALTPANTDSLVLRTAGTPTSSVYLPRSSAWLMPRCPSKSPLTTATTRTVLAHTTLLCIPSLTSPSYARYRPHRSEMDLRNWSRSQPAHTSTRSIYWTNIVSSSSTPPLDAQTVHRRRSARQRIRSTRKASMRCWSLKHPTSTRLV